jgi:single-stranded-DNA-specific exonuclease
MSLGIECLLTDDPKKARDIALILSEMNDERRIIEQDMQEQAMQILAKLQPDKNDQLPMGICLFDNEWHQGVIGIVASRIKERFHRPVIAFAPSGDIEIKGSARSIPGLHIRDVLAQIAVEHPTLIDKFGGHAMAAGLTLPRSKFEAFAKVFDAAVANTLTEEQLHNKLLSDGELKQSDLTLKCYVKQVRGGRHFLNPYSMAALKYWNSVWLVTNTLKWCWDWKS